MYLVIDDKTKEAAVVDPWDHEQMTQRVQEEGVKVSQAPTHPSNEPLIVGDELDYHASP
jgi:hypothetical protein